MRRPDTVHQAASPSAIMQWRSIRNPVKRIGAFSEGQSEKAALDERLQARHFRGQIGNPQPAGHSGKKAGKPSATLPRDERDRFRLPMPHQARDNCTSTNGVINNSDHGKRWGHRVRQNLQSVVQHKDGSGGEGLSPWHETGTIPAVGAT